MSPTAKVLIITVSHVGPNVYAVCTSTWLTVTNINTDYNAYMCWQIVTVNL